jgi:hypothetical protein
LVRLSGYHSHRQSSVNVVVLRCGFLADANVFKYHLVDGQINH